MAGLLSDMGQAVLRSLRSLTRQQERGASAAPVTRAELPTPFEVAASLMKAPIRPDILEYIAQLPADSVEVVRQCLGILVRKCRTDGKEPHADRLLYFFDYLTQMRHEGHESMMRAVEENWRARAYDAMQMMLYSDTEQDLVATVIAYHDTLRDTNAALEVAQDMRANEAVTHFGIGPRLDRLVKIAQLCEHHEAEAAVEAVPPPPPEAKDARAAIAMMRDSVLKKALMRLLEAPDAKGHLDYLRMRRHVLLSDLAERRLDLLWERSLDGGPDGQVLAVLQKQREILYECRETGIERAIGCAAPVNRESPSSPAAAAMSPGAD